MMEMRRIGDAALASALKTVRIEQEALNILAIALEDSALCDAFKRTVAAIAATSGRLIVSGMGKSGIMGRKIAATMTSTGTPSLFIHPGEASHGDLGMITPEDIVLAITWSGETTELGDLIAYCHRFAIKLIVATARPDSTAGKAADICLVLPHVREACPNQLAPTSSTTLQAVLGDALAIALIEQRGFSKSDFLTFHPGGQLGAQLVTVEQLMGRDDEVPTVRLGASLMDATFEMSRKRYGSTAVVDTDGNLVGAFTDGDLRRSFATQHLHDPIEAHMTPNPLSVPGSTLSTEALRIMNANAVTVLFVCDGAKLIGALHMHDLLRTGVV
ncbi:MULTISPECIES: KpsF/GutQ family sugar-phosphate isomerase [unclassified Sphingomonas]|uniref:KpsF/GutQ family sugar-phosphate isomerase n=1 Tax=unclassified Sphingomonas TaxID=196159 RepID=UPI00226B277C|nr:MULTISPECIES: KpsF/GutQ family sugar-phosphate isomerase [unclassified Sphingomonas]